MALGRRNERAKGVSSLDQGLFGHIVKSYELSITESQLVRAVSYAT